MKQKNEFVFPEKWCIIIDSENYEYLNTYLHNYKDKYLGYNKDWKVTLSDKRYDELEYFYSESKEKPYHTSYLKINGFEEITFYQFKEHVLKEIPKPEYDPKDVAFKNDVYSNSEFNSESKIIGYKFIKEEYYKTFCTLRYGIYSYETDHRNISIERNSKLIEHLKTAGVIHWFEPVFEEKKIKLTS